MPPFSARNDPLATALTTPTSFHGPPLYPSDERDSMACPEKDTTDPEKETRKGGKGCKISNKTF
jgi:hypothetical protein